MAIVKMKHLRLVAMAEDREKLLKLLQHMGGVEVTEPEADTDDPAWAGLKRVEDNGAAAARETQSSAERALDVLKRYAPTKGSFLAPKPSVEEEQLFDQQSAQSAQSASEEINALENRLISIRAEENKLTAQKAVLAPWLGLDLPLEAGSTTQVTIQLGTLPAAVNWDEIQAALGEAAELTQLLQVSADTVARYCLLICHKDQAAQALDVLKNAGWARANLRDWKGTAAENAARLDEQLSGLAQEVTQIEEKLAGMGGLQPALQQLSDLAGVEVSREETKTRLLDTSQTFYLEGWVPAESWPELEKALESYPCAIEAADPDPEDYPKVPVQLKNGWFAKPLNMVTDMYSLPAYGSVDPNPLMAPFFILFYGMMMADMGYGLVMILISLVVMKKAKPDGPTMRYMMPLLGLCGVSTFLWGAATGGFFGDLIPQLIKLMNPDSTFAMPKLFDPLDKAVNVLVGALALGVVQIFTGMAVSMYKQIKQGEVMAALCNEGAWYLVFVLAGVAAVTGQVKPCVIAIVILLVLTQGYGKKGVVGKLMGIFGSLYNNITGYFSDILSYSRLMALMLSGAVTAQVFNTLGAMTGNVVVFFIVALVGNALNFALNILGCFVHDMRLQCLEYFGRFYEDGGKPFEPLKINTTYNKIVK